MVSESHNGAPHQLAQDHDMLLLLLLLLLMLALAFRLCRSSNICVSSFKSCGCSSLSAAQATNHPDCHMYCKPQLQ